MRGKVTLLIKCPSAHVKDAVGYVSLKFKEVWTGDINLGVMLSVERMENTEKCREKKETEQFCQGVIDVQGTAHT